MKRLIVILLGLSFVLLVSVAAEGRTQTAAKESEGYHHLLMLDQREAGEHAKALHHYVLHHANALDRAIVAKHVDELGRNLQGMRDELTKLEEVSKGEVPIPRQLTQIREHQTKAMRIFETLKSEAQKPALNAEALQFISSDLYGTLRLASGQHNKTMTKLGIREPTPPHPCALPEQQAFL